MENLCRLRYIQANVKRHSFISASLLFVVAVVSGCTQTAPAGPPAQSSGGVTVAMTVLPSPPHVGDNTVTLVVTDTGTGAPIGDANLRVIATMLAPHLPPMMEVSGRAQGNGTYTAPIRLGVATRYDLQVSVKRPAVPAIDLHFPVEAAQ